LHEKYQVLLANSESSLSEIPEELAINLYAANALTVTKYIAFHPDTANINELADFMIHIYGHLFKSSKEEESETLQELGSETILEIIPKTLE